MRFRESQDGPRLVTPKPYQSCRGCNFFEEVLVSSGGLRGNRISSTSCHHPDSEYRFIKNRAIGMDRSNKRTPGWCPFLRKNDPVDLSDSVEDNHSE